jgi:hypothetical protein
MKKVVGLNVILEPASNLTVESEPIRFQVPSDIVNGPIQHYILQEKIIIKQCSEQ